MSYDAGLGKKATSHKVAFLHIAVAPPGLEPGKTVPKTGVLPLHHGAFRQTRSEDNQA